MLCPKCESYNTIVYDSRLRKNDTERKRWRRCTDCGYSWTTLEMRITASDIAQIVKCKECKHMMLLADNFRYCKVWHTTNGVGDDGFCNYGEMRYNDG